VQTARHDAGEFAHPGAGAGGGLGEPLTWLAAQAAIAVALFAALVWATLAWSKVNGDLPLNSTQRQFGWVLLVAGLVVFGGRGAWLGLRLLSGARGRRG
jgi:uncharacterized membrane protein YeiH